MIRYRFSYKNPATRLLYLTASFPSIAKEQVFLQLPAWRPGRYEMAYFARNIVSFQVYGEHGTKLPCRKITRDCWEITTQGNKTIQAVYTYYAGELNAGSTFLCGDFLYVNPVNCCVYIPDQTAIPCEIQLDVPDDYQIAIALREKAAKIYEASNYHHLADSPFVASNMLQGKRYLSNGTSFCIWFNGHIEVAWERVLRDFKSFTDQHYEVFGSFPFSEYHFIIHALPYKAYHGVEHLCSTVITLGPADALMGELYDELLGICSHELFHSWNVKAIRPAEMMPYDYARENYTRLGYVAEGVTTYYGDLLLLRAHLMGRDQWKNLFDQLLERHFQQFGRYNMSVADSSFDTWLDGYKPGVPNRKVSIYTEGALCAFMCDIIIRKNTGNRKSLDNVMRLMYERFGTSETGYTEYDYQSMLEEVSGRSFSDFFHHYIHGTSDYLPILQDCLYYLGYQLVSGVRDNVYETAFGFKLIHANNCFVINAVFPGSEAENKGMELDDEILLVNGKEITDINQLNEYAAQSALTLHLRNFLHKQKLITIRPGNYYKKYSVVRIHEMTEQQARNYALWAGIITLPQEHFAQNLCT